MGNGDYKMKYEIVGRKKEIKKLDEIAENRPLFSAGPAFFWGLFYAIIT
jgi:hypothetical protein